MYFNTLDIFFIFFSRKKPDAKKKKGTAKQHITFFIQNPQLPTSTNGGK